MSKLNDRRLKQSLFMFKDENALNRIEDKISRLKEAQQDQTALSKRDIDELIPTLPELNPYSIALFLEAKSRSRTAKGEKYEPFVITDDNLHELKNIITETKAKNEPFKFDFIFINEGHCLAMEAFSENNDTYLFQVDSTARGASVEPQDIVGEGATYIKCNTESQYDIKSCRAFSFANLSELSKMTLAEKLKMSDENVPSRMRRNAQSLTPLKGHETEVISKPEKPSRTLLDSIQSSVVELKIHTGSETKQSGSDTRILTRNTRILDKDAKSWSRAGEIIKNSTEEELESIIVRRTTPSSSLNSYVAGQRTQEKEMISEVAPASLGTNSNVTDPFIQGNNQPNLRITLDSHTTKALEAIYAKKYNFFNSREM